MFKNKFLIFLIIDFKNIKLRNLNLQSIFIKNNLK